MRIHLAVLLAAGLLATPAQAFTAINGLTVNPVPGGFEVVARGSDGPRQIWCAAGQFARASTATTAGNPRVYVLAPYGPSQTRPGWRGVSFTTTPDAALAEGPRLGDGGNYSVRIRDAGFSLTARQAEVFCSDVWDELADNWPRRWP